MRYRGKRRLVDDGGGTGDVATGNAVRNEGTEQKGVREECPFESQRKVSLANI